MWWEETFHGVEGQTPDEAWRLCQYMWEDGNYGCDCNRSLFAQRYGWDIPELPCGDTIELVSLTWLEEL